MAKGLLFCSNCNKESMKVTGCSRKDPTSCRIDAKCSTEDCKAHLMMLLSNTKTSCIDCVLYKSHK